MPWTEETLVLLRQLHEDGLSATLILREMHRRLGISLSRSAVMGKLWRMGLCGSSRLVVARPERPSRPPRRRPAAAVALRSRPAPRPRPRLKLLCALMELRAGQCRWPVGDDRYCGRGVSDARRSYCDEHHALAHEPERRRADHYVWLRGA